MAKRTIKEILHLTTGHFKKYGLDNPRLEAEVLLADLLGKDRISLYVDYDQPLAEEELEAMRQRIRRRQQGTPLAYIVGEKEFMSLPFYVSPSVLIPRPETEHLVERTLAIFSEGAVEVVDVGTGSGAVAVSLAYYRPTWHVAAVDIDAAALKTARKNAERHGVQDRVTFYLSDLLQALPPAVKPDCILANPPYIASDALPELAAEVQAQPRQALDGGRDGMKYYRPLIKQAACRLPPWGWLGLEVGVGQLDRVAALIEAESFTNIEFIEDYGGHKRCIFAQKKGEGPCSAQL